MALRASGRLKVRVTTGPSRVTRVSSCVGTARASLSPRDESPHRNMPLRFVGAPGSRRIERMARPAGLILDYGNVLTYAQDQTWMDGAARRLGADAAAFRAAYWQHRHAYDADLTAAEYWGRVLAASRPGAGLAEPREIRHRLVERLPRRGLGA